MSNRKSILFVIHSASRNGASRVLLYFLRWLKAHTNYDTEVLVHGRGEMLDEFRSIGRTKVWRTPRIVLNRLPKVWRSFVERFWDTQYLKAIVRAKQYDLVYVNTVANWVHVPFLSQRSTTLLWHVHELPQLIRLLIQDGSWRRVFPMAERFVAVSSLVRDCLVGEFDVAEEKVDVVYEFIPSTMLSSDSQGEARDRVRRELGISPGCCVVGGCGRPERRKGADLFVEVARVLLNKQLANEVKFLWVGGETGGSDALKFEAEVRAQRLEQKCTFVPTTPRVLDYMCAMDIFALTSREDPFPLVMLEAASVGVPTVCFAGSGGGPEFVGQRPELVANYEQSEDFAAKIVGLIKNAALRANFGSDARRLVEEVYNVEKQCPRLLHSMERCLSGTSRLVRR